MEFGTVKLNDGNELPSIAFGTAPKHKDADLTDVIIQAIEAGFYHLDTAQNYFGSQRNVQGAIKQCGLARPQFFITTKYGSGTISKTVRESLEALGLEYVDLYLVHHPSLINEGDWTEFEKIKHEGLARSIGVSNYNVQELQDLLKTASIKPVLNQIELHPYNYAEKKTLLEYAAECNIVIEAFGSLNPITKYPGGPVDVPVDVAARRRGATANQILFLWAIAKGAMIVTASSKKLRLEEYLAVPKLHKQFPLTEDEIAAIDAAGAQGSPSPEVR